ncbi:MAG: hypothetical protein WDA27_08860 [Actinomycetota bacterium]
MRGMGKSRAVWVLAAVIAAVVAPGAARASAPTINFAEAFGDAQPEVDADAAKRLFATSLPYGFGEPGLAYVRGNATPGVYVTVTVSDGVSKVSRRVTSATDDDVQAGVTRGDFNAELHVTEFGAHSSAAPSCAVSPRPDPCVDPATSDFTRLGPTSLDFTFVATSLDGSSSEPVVLEGALTKYAARPFDKVAPKLSRMTWPPMNWCHLSGSGVDAGPTGQDYPGQGQGLGLGGSTSGSCGRTPAPDVTWGACAVGPTGTGLPAGPSEVTPPRAWCSTTSPSQSIPRGEALVSGLADDNWSGAMGVASEIASIHVQVWQGQTMLRSIPSITRFGPRAAWGVTLRINDFEPNFPRGTPYDIKVIVTDAWGNTATTQASYGITVYPW